ATERFPSNSSAKHAIKTLDRMIDLVLMAFLLLSFFSLFTFSRPIARLYRIGLAHELAVLGFSVPAATFVVYAAIRIHPDHSRRGWSLRRAAGFRTLGRS